MLDAVARGTTTTRTCVLLSVATVAPAIVTPTLASAYPSKKASEGRVKIER